MREQKGGDKKITLITNLDAAIAASKVAGTYLQLNDSLASLLDEVTNLKGFSRNVATAFEVAAAKAASIDQTLTAKFGAGTLLGVGTVFVTVDTGSNFVEIDGLVLCSGMSPSRGVLLVVEAKTHLHTDDLDKMRRTKEKLIVVMSSPGLFASSPDAGMLGQIAGHDGLVVELVAAAGSCDSAVAAQCLARGIHLMEPSGAGFSCRLAT